MTAPPHSDDWPRALPHVVRMDSDVFEHLRTGVKRFVIVGTHLDCRGGDGIEIVEVDPTLFARNPKQWERTGGETGRSVRVRVDYVQGSGHDLQALDESWHAVGVSLWMPEWE